MSNRFTKSALLCLAAALPGLLIAQNPAVGPRIGLDDETVELGQVVRGKVVEAEFVYRNDGDAPLRILRAKPG